MKYEYKSVEELMGSYLQIIYLSACSDCIHPFVRCSFDLHSASLVAN